MDTNAPRKFKFFTLATCLLLATLCGVLDRAAALVSGDCVAPDSVRYPLTWQGSETDHNCTVDETRTYDRMNFMYVCTAVNCQMKYGTDTSDQSFAFDDTCRQCKQCANTVTDSEECPAPSIVVDDGCPSTSDCESDVDCGPHGSNFGLYACECDDGFKTDVNSNSYCDVTDITNQEGLVNTTSSELSDVGTQIVVAVGLICAGIVLIAVCVGALSATLRRNAVDKIYPSGRPLGSNPKVVTFNVSHLNYYSQFRGGELLHAVKGAINWPEKPKTK